MARLFTSGFEIDSTTAFVEWTDIANASLTTGTVRTGARAYSVSTFAIARGFLQQFLATAAAGPYFVRFYFNRGSLPGAGNTIFLFTASLGVTSASSTDAGIRLTTGGALALFNGTTQIGSDSSTLTSGTWYRVEVAYDNSPSAGSKVLAAYLDGVQFAGDSTLSTVGSGNVRSIALGGNLASGGSGGPWTFDDVAINDGTGSTQNGLPGDGQVITLFPNGAGDLNEWQDTAGGAGTSSNYSLVDENPPNDATDFVQIHLANKVDLYNFGASGLTGSPTIGVVQALGRHANVTADGVASYALVARAAPGGTQVQGSSVIPATTTFRTGKAVSTANRGLTGASLTMYTDPDGAAWTPATVDSLQVGPKFVTPNFSGIKVSAVWVTVDYTASVGPPPASPIFPRRPTRGLIVRGRR